LTLPLTGATAATALTGSIAVALSVRTTAAALTRTALPAESGTLTGGLAAAMGMTSRSMATMTLTVVAIPIAIRIELSAAGPEREVRRLALGSLSFGPWQLRTNQRTMHRPFVAV
jgi:hypothetical protein